MQLGELILTGVATLSLFFFGIVLKGFDKRIEKNEDEVKEVTSNYNDKFLKVHEKLDKIIELHHELDKKLEIQIQFCQLVQKQKE